MKKVTLIIVLLFASFAFTQVQTVTYSINPSTFEDNQSITITINGNSINETTWASGNNLYLWAWSFDSNDSNELDCPTNGLWSDSNETNKLVYRKRRSRSWTQSSTLAPSKTPRLRQT